MDRDEIALEILLAMIRSAPIADRTAVNEKLWSEKAYRWADAFLTAGRQL